MTEKRPEAANTSITPSDPPLYVDSLPGETPIPSQTHGASMPVTEPTHDELIDGNKMADPNPDIIISKVSNCSAISNNDAANHVGSSTLI